MNGRILVGGGVLQRAGYGGHAWAFAQWVRGLRELGAEATFVDRVHDGWTPSPADCEVLALLGGPERVAVLGPDGASLYGLSRCALDAAARGADLLLNVMGYLDDEVLLAGPRKRVFLDIDPGFGQMWRALGLADIFVGHDAHVTVGTTITGSGVPDCGLAWIPTVPPVHLPDWPCQPPAPDAPVTAIASWRGPFGPIELDGVTYGLRVHEFRRFLALAARAPQQFELALDIDPTDGTDREALLEHGWRLVDPLPHTGTPEDYRRYVCASKAELMIAKHLYVATGAGWFSDRSACYLASGRPVLAQDTGFSAVLPTGDGLVTFTSPDEAVEAAADLDARYEEHSRAARALAEEHLDAARVLPRVLEAVAA